MRLQKEAIFRPQNTQTKRSQHRRRLAPLIRMRLQSEAGRQPQKPNNINAPINHSHERQRGRGHERERGRQGRVIKTFRIHFVMQLLSDLTFLTVFVVV